MKNRIVILSGALLLLCATALSAATPYAVLSPKEKEFKEKMEALKDAELTPAQEAKMARKKAKLEKKMKKWEKKAALKSEKQTNNIWGNMKFRIGIILLAGALALGLVALLVSLGGVINFLAGLFALAGVVFLVWSLIEYSS